MNANQKDAAARSNELAQIQDGLRSDDTGNRWYWLSMARRRITALTEDGDLFGLVAHEEQELAALKRMLAEIGEEVEENG